MCFINWSVFFAVIIVERVSQIAFDTDYIIFRRNSAISGVRACDSRDSCFETVWFFVKMRQDFPKMTVKFHLIYFPCCNHQTCPLKFYKGTYDCLITSHSIDWVIKNDFCITTKIKGLLIFNWLRGLIRCIRLLSSTKTRTVPKQESLESHTRTSSHRESEFKNISNGNKLFLRSLNPIDLIKPDKVKRNKIKSNPTW